MRSREFRDFDDYDFDRDDWVDEKSADDGDGDTEEREETLDEILASARELTDDSTEISMEIDEDGNEVWYAEDPKIPGSSSLGNSLEEAMEGMEDRRREFRELVSRSGERRDRSSDQEDVSAAELAKARKQYREKLKRSRKRHGPRPGPREP